VLLAICAFSAVLGCSKRSQPAAHPPSLAENGSPAASGSTTTVASAETTVALAETTVAWADAYEFTLPIPDGYRNATAEFPGAGFSVVLAKNEETELDENEETERYRSAIVIRKVSIPGGSFDEPTECAQTGRGLVQGGMFDQSGDGYILKSAQIIDGPVGRTCQIHLIAPQGVALITELHRPGNSRSAPKGIWLMTCNHVDGDDLAESACRFALSGFQFRDE